MALTVSVHDLVAPVNPTDSRYHPQAITTGTDRHCENLFVVEVILQ